MFKRVAISLLMGAITLPTVSSSNRMFTEGVQPDMIRHLEYAEDGLMSGHPERAIAHSEIVLLDRTMRVRVDLTDVPEQRWQVVTDALQGAFEMWHEAMEGKVRFAFAEPGEAAEISVSFVRNLQYGRSPVSGLVHWRRSVRPIGETIDASTSATIQLRLRTPGDRSWMSMEQMRHAAAHELGHVLGLADSRRRGDIMGALDLRRPECGVKDHEIENLRRLREAAAEVRREAVVTVLSKV